jgi:hypothetical protein
LLLVDVLLCDWLCFWLCLLLKVFVLDSVLVIGPTVELPELLTPLLDDELPPVALLLPPVAFAPDVDVDVAPEVLLDVLDVVLGVVGGVTGTTLHSYRAPL